MSSESRRNLSKSLMGHTPWNKGIPCSDDTKYKISLANGKPIYCVETGVVYRSRTEAIIVTGLHGIKDCLRGRQKTSGGYHWDYFKGVV